MGGLTGKRALVTGASRGIGAAIAVALAQQGADVVISYERSADLAAKVVDRIEKHKRRAVAVQADNADPAAIRRLVEETAEALGGIDILVNNAGIARAGPLPDMTLTDIDAMLNVNVRAAVLASQAVIPYLRDGGRIITIGSCLAERVPYGNLTAYSMTKSAILAFTKGLARDLGSRGITVNTVQPGPIDTDQNPASGGHADVNRSLTALGRYGTVDEVAAAVVFLASPAASFVTGSALTVDGGINA